MHGARAPKQVWKLGDGEELLPDGSVLCPGTRRQDGSFRKATRRRKGYYNDEDLQRNVYKPNAVRVTIKPGAGSKFEYWSFDFKIYLPVWEFFSAITLKLIPFLGIKLHLFWKV